jgi:hypothetical protein
MSSSAGRTRRWTTESAFGAKAAGDSVSGTACRAAGGAVRERTGASASLRVRGGWVSRDVSVGGCILGGCVLVRAAIPGWVEGLGVGSEAWASCCCIGGSEGCVSVAPTAAPARLSASSTSSIDWKRSSRRFARQRRTIASSSGGTSMPGWNEASCGVGSVTCLRMMSTELSASKGTRPVSMWKSSTPSE